MDNNLGGSSSKSSSVNELEKRIFPRTRKAKRVKFYRNGDKFFAGIIIPVLAERYRTFDSLIADLTRSLGGNATLPNGVRNIYTLDGRKILKVDDLEDGQSYVCSGVRESFKRLDYEAIADNLQSFKLGPANGSNSNAAGNGVERISPVRHPGISRSPVVTRSHIATFIRNGIKPRKVCRLLLNKRNSQNLEQLMAAITECMKLDTGCVRKVFTQSGSLVTTLEQFFEKDVFFFAYGNERVNQEDFNLDSEESKAIMQLKKSTIHRVIRTGASPGMPARADGAACAAAVEADGSVIANSLDASLLPNPLRLKYNVGKIIGEGNFAVVLMCTDKTTEQKYALKLIDKRQSRGKEQYITAETRVMRKLCHPHIITLYDEYETPEWLFLVLEFVNGGDLFDSIATAGKYSEEQSRLLLSHLISAVAYMHSLSIVHRDIKPENLLVHVASDGSIRGLKLADFGLAVEVHEPLKAICGTPTYVAPEILLQTGYGLKIDMWAAGVILYVMLCGFPPFAAVNGDQEKLFDSILSGRFEFPLPYWENVSAGAIDLITNMMRPQPELRFAAEDVLDHVWMSVDYDSMNDRNWFGELA